MDHFFCQMKIFTKTLILAYLAGLACSENKIPSTIWVAVKDRNDELPSHLKLLFSRNSNWKVNICDNECKDSFMNENFAGSDILWAYNLLDVWAAKADIWRYCVLYIHGGLYIDDDSDIKTYLDDVVNENDNMILAEEGASSLGDCFQSSFHLSNEFLYSHFPNIPHNTSHFNGINSDSNYIFFHGNTIVNWAIFSMPSHPLLIQTLKNIVEVIKSDYLGMRIVMITKWDVKWKQVFCSTNFILTHTLKEMILESLPLEFVPRICRHDFVEYGGKAKAIWTGGDPNHYMKAMKDLLKERINPPPSLDKMLFYLDGQIVNSDANGNAARAIYLIKNGKKQIFNDYETFLNMNFKNTQVRVISNSLLDAIPDGLPVSKLENKNLENNIQNSKVKNNNQIHKFFKTNHTNNGKSKIHHHRRHHSHSHSHSHPVESQIEINPQIKQNYLLLESVKNAIEKESKENKDLSLVCYKDDYAGTRDEFISGKWNSIIKENNFPVFVYPLCLNTFQLGNTLGYYFNDLACAQLLGVHYISVGKIFLIQDPDSLSNPVSNHLTFMDSLPKILPHLNPVENIDIAKRNAKKMCPCIRYCWENKEAPWLKITNLISEYMLHAIDSYIDNSDISHGTILSSATDLLYYPNNFEDEKTERNGNNQDNVEENDKDKEISVSSHPYLPIIPDVTIQYRCGDNIGFGKTRYGLLPFPAIISRIYSTAKYIYVIADSPNRSSGHPYNSRCGIILQALFDGLKENFPNSVVIIKRGGDLFLDIARLAYSNVTICSASTFCLWPALANRGTVHFPYTPLIAGGWNNESLPDFGMHFKWILEVEILKEFKQFKPWEKVLDVLRTQKFSE